MLQRQAALPRTHGGGMVYVLVEVLKLIWRALGRSPGGPGGGRRPRRLEDASERVMMACMALLPASYVVMQPSHLATQALLHPATTVHARSGPGILMVDPALVAESSTALLPALVGAPAAIDPHYDPHTMANLVPDLFNTCLLATVGLLGAYVTQGTEGTVAEDELGDTWQPTVPRRQLRGSAFDDVDEEDEFLESLR